MHSKITSNTIIHLYVYRDITNSDGGKNNETIQISRQLHLIIVLKSKALDFLTVT